MRTRTARLAVLLLIAAPAGGLAQQPDGAPRRVRAFAGGALQIAQPVGEFGDHVDTGFGVGGHFLYALDRGAALGIRVEGGAVNYGNERRAVPISPTVGGRITVDLTTSNDILTLAAGPQLMLPNGRLRPYAFAAGGLAYFVTESSLRGDHGGDVFATTNNFDDLTLAVGGGAGLYIPLRRGDTPISIDLGARFHRNGRARYLREGSIRDNPDGSVTFSPIESEADLVTLHVGVSAALGRARSGRR